MNIPIYRAKKIDSDEYVIGWYSSPIIIEGKLYLSIINQDGEYKYALGVFIEFNTIKPKVEYYLGYTLN